MKTLLLLFTTLTLSLYSFSQNTEPIQDELPLYYPGTLFFGNGKSIMTPQGWGGHQNIIFVGGGMALRQTLQRTPDGGATLNLGLGNSFNIVGVEIGTKMNDLSMFNNFSYNIKIHKYLGKGTSIAIGGDHMFFNPEESDGITSYYLSISHAFQNTPSKIPGLSRFNLNVGIGSGKFAQKSPRDIRNGKGENGTYVFGSLAYQLFLNHSLILEWSGVNLNAGISSRPFKKFPMTLQVNLVDLTPNSGNGVRVVVGGGFSYSLNQK